MGMQGDACCCCILFAFGGYLGLFLFVLYHIFLKRRPRADGLPRCPQCEYLLRGLSSNRCPECGRTFDPSRLPADPEPVEGKAEFEWPIGDEPEDDESSRGGWDRRG